MNRAGQLAGAWVLLALAARAATLTVAYGKTMTVPLPQATAAYTVDPTIAEASADSGSVTVIGKSPGTTHLVVITAGGIETFDIVVPVPPLSRPKGFVLPRPSDEAAESGFAEVRYSSLPQQLTNIVGFSSMTGTLGTQFHLATTEFFPANNNVDIASSSQSRFAITSLSYAFTSERRKVTLVDQAVMESPLTINGTVIRGLHWQEGNWFFHGGYTSPATFENVFLPVQRERIVGGGYRQKLSEHATLTSSLYQVAIPKLTQTGRSGMVYSLLYSYRPRPDFWVNAELGASRGMGGSFDLSYRRTGENLRVRARYSPATFAALSLNDYRGIYSDLSWSRQWTEKFGSDAFFTGNRYNLVTLQELSVSGGVQLRDRIARHWTLLGGATYSRFQVPGQPALIGTYFPAGLDFSTRYLGLGFQQQWSSYTGQDQGGRQMRASMHTGWGAFRVNGFAEKESQAPAVSFLLTQVDGLQQLLAASGATVTTPQQLGDFLRDNAALINLGYLRNISVNIIPERQQAGGTAAWEGRGARPQIAYEFLYNKDETVTSSNQIWIHRATLTQRLGASNDLLLSWSEYRTKVPGQPTHVDPIYTASVRHQFLTAPGFLVLEHHGVIRGRVFVDQDGQGNLTASEPGMAGVELVLDQTKRTRTGSDGSYRFSGVVEGMHQVEAVLPKDKPYYFTTPSAVETAADTQVNFGLALSLSSLSGEVVDDSGRGISDVMVTIRGGGHEYAATSGSNGKLLVPRLVEGTYEASIEADSLPPGYSIAGSGIERASVTEGSAAHVTLRVRVLRNLSGRVLVYDRSLLQYAPVPEVRVTLNELSRTSTTDKDGRYLFRELPAGTFSLSIVYQGQPFNQIATLADEPGQPSEVNFIVGTR